MPFLFICNPIHGDFSNKPENLVENVISQGLCEYDNWVPSLYVKRGDSTARA